MMEDEDDFVDLTQESGECDSSNANTMTAGHEQRATPSVSIGGKRVSESARNAVSSGDADLLPASRMQHGAHGLSAASHGFTTAAAYSSTTGTGIAGAAMGAASAGQTVPVTSQWDELEYDDRCFQGVVDESAYLPPALIPHRSGPVSHAVQQRQGEQEEEEDGLDEIVSQSQSFRAPVSSQSLPPMYSQASVELSFSSSVASGGAGTGTGRGTGGGGKRKKGMSAEEKAAAQEARAAERASLRAAKAASLAVAKEESKAARVSARVAAGGYALQEIGLCMSIDLHSSAIGEAIRVACAGKGEEEGIAAVAFTVLEPLPLRSGPPPPASASSSSADALGSYTAGNPHHWTQLTACVQWRRGVLLSSHGTPTFDFRSPAACPEPWVLCVLPGKVWLGMLEGCRREAVVAGDGRVLARVLSLVRGMQKKAPAQCTTLLLLVHGLASACMEAFKAWGCGDRRGPPPLTLDQCDALHNHVYVEAGVEVQAQYSKVEQVGEAVRRLTKVIAQAPYKGETTGLSVIHKEKVYLKPKGEEAGEGSGGRSLSDTYLAMLCMIPGMSLDKARAILHAYPTWHSLMEVYHSASKSAEEKQGLVAGLIRAYSAKEKEKNYGKLSRDVYLFFTSGDPSVMIGSAATAASLTAGQGGAGAGTG